MIGKKAKIAIICASVLLIVAIAIITPLLCIWFDMPTLDGGARVVAYVTSESIDYYGIEEFDFSNVTHVIYSFARVTAGEQEIAIEHPQYLEALSHRLRAQYPDVKLMLSISSTYMNDGLCDATRTEQNLSVLVDSCVEAYGKYNLDGFDIDWEYPKFNNGNIKECEHCTMDHARFIMSMRESLPKDALLSFAAGIRLISLAYDNNALKDVVDFVNVMNYDFSTSRNSPFSESKINTFNYLILGYKKEQINWGLPFYNRCDNIDYDYYHYFQIMQLAREGKAQIYDDKDCTYAIYDGQKLSFDTYNVIKKKTQYVKQHGYGGVFCWNLAGDMNRELLPMIWDILR